jgi:hypothetical protein
MRSLMMDEVTGEWRKLNNEELNDGRGNRGVEETA